MTYAIECHIPVPERSRSWSTYPFADMNPGDSFFVASAPANTKRTQQKLSSCAVGFQRRNPGVRFTTRKVDGGVRVWRVA